MDKFLLPSIIDVKEGDHENHSIIEVSPCYFGYGATLGNALRRVLLSSLEGGAVVAVKIDGVQHEFSAIEGVQEDALEVILNFKRLNLKVYSDEPVKLHIKKKGEGPVTAGDIKADSSVEIANPDLVLATVTDKKATFEAEVYVEKGRGYVTSEQREERNDEVGMMAVDSIFSPVVRVGYKVENTRVGQITDYDKLVLSVETDGTMSPQEAVEQASQILIDYLSLLTKSGSEESSDTE